MSKSMVCVDNLILEREEFGMRFTLKGLARTFAVGECRVFLLRQRLFLVASIMPPVSPGRNEILQGGCAQVHHPWQ
jgi:hypothetical protein